MSSSSMSRAQKAQLKTGPEYKGLVGASIKATDALNHHIFNVVKGPIPSDHPLRLASYAAHDAVLAHLTHHNPSASKEAEIMGYSDPIQLKAMEDTAGFRKKA